MSQDFCAAVASEIVLRLGSTASATDFSRQHLSNTMCGSCTRFGQNNLMQRLY